MTNVAPDASRRRSKFNTLEGGTLNLDTNQCEPTNQTIDEVIPVNVGFNLFIYTRHIDDTLQIVEQILPYFSPDHIIQIDMNAVQQGVRIPIIMTSNNITEKYDGDFGNRRINISSISFVAKAFIYGPIKGITTIQNTDLNLDLKDNNYYE
jgi:hypothetical protein